MPTDCDTCDNTGLIPNTLQDHPTDLPMLAGLDCDWLVRRALSADPCVSGRHVVQGVGNSTDPEKILWADHCDRCGVAVTIEKEARDG